MNQITLNYRLLSSIKPYENNPRINHETVQKLVKGIQQYGFLQPILVDESGVIITGHARYLAAEILKLKEVPVTHDPSLTPEQIRAYRLADNRVSELSEWDTEKLSAELQTLQNLDLDLSVLSFTPMELSVYLQPDPEPAPKRSPPKPERRVPVPEQPARRPQQGTIPFMINPADPPPAPPEHKPYIEPTQAPPRPLARKKGFINLELDQHQNQKLETMLPHLQREFRTQSLTVLIMDALEYAFNTTGGEFSE